MTSRLRRYSDMELLKELLSRNPPVQGPTRQTHDRTIRQSLVGIGKDNLAFIQLHTDDIEALDQLLTGELEHG